MSSHHIVRENQEPALLVHQVERLSEEALGQLLEWSPTILAEADLQDWLDAKGLKLDVAFLHADTVISMQEHTKQVEFSTNFLKAALAYLVQTNHKAVNIITDCLDLDFYREFLDQITIVLLCDNMRYTFVNTGFTKWKPIGERIEIYPQKLTIQTEGLRQISETTFEMIASSHFKISFDAGDYIKLGETIA